MHSIFVTTNTLYVLVWNLALQPSNGQDPVTFAREMVEEQVHWATLIQTCAPGSRVVLVGSHSDEVADPAEIPRLLSDMAQGVRGELSKYCEAQQRELDQLTAMQTPSPNHVERSDQLQQLLSNRIV